MTPQGIVVIDLIGILLIVLVIRLLQKRLMYVGYAVIWILLILSGMIVISIEPLLTFVTRLLGALIPVSALTLAALLFIVLALIYFSVQLSILSSRVTELSQFIGINELEKSQRDNTGQSEEGQTRIL